MASPIRMTGLSSGLDTESIVKALTSGYQTKVDNYKKAQTKVSWKQEAWQDVNKKVYSLYTSLDSMRFSSNWRMQKATVSDATKATASANGKAFTGTQKLAVVSTAATASMTGGNLGSSISGTSTLRDLGFTTSKGGTIVLNSAGKRTEINVTSSTTINDFVSQLKSAGVSANFDQNRLFISANKAGETNGFTFTADDDNGLDALGKLGLLSEDVADAATSKYSALGVNDDSTVDSVTASIEGLVKDYKAQQKIVSDGQKNIRLYDLGITYAQNYTTLQDGLKKYSGLTEDDIALMKYDSEDLLVMGDDGKTIEAYKPIKDADGNITGYSSDGSADNKKVITKGDDGNYTLTTKGDGDNEDKQDVSSYVKGVAGDLQNEKVLDSITSVMFKDLKDENGNAVKYSGLTEEDKKAVANEAMDIYNAKVQVDGMNGDNYADLRTMMDTQIITDPDDSSKTYTGLAAFIKANYADGEDSVEKINKMALSENKAVNDANKELATDKYKLVASLAAMEGAGDDGTGAKGTDGKVTDAGTAYETAVKNMATDAVMAQKISGHIDSTKTASFTAGSKAEIILNGVHYTNDSGNGFSVNGLNITALSETGKDSNGNYNTINIGVTNDTQALYDKVKDFFSTYNDVINDLADRYNAASSSDYEPLTEDEKSEMTDSQVEKWEKKGKEGLLRRDDTLGSIMDTITNTMLKTYTLSNGKKYSLASFGIMTKGILNAASNRQYEYHIDGDEDDTSTASNADKLMSALNSDPDSVVEFMQDLTNDLYTNLDKKMKRTSMRSAYTVYNDKEMASEYSSYTTLIKQWETRLSTMEDSYYKKFSKMESTLSSLQSSTNSLSSYLGS